MAEVSFNEVINFSRASTGTYWGPSGTLLEAAVDEARIQHDPVTGKALGLLVESEATNRLVNSYFGNGSSSGWVLQGETFSVEESDTAFGGYVAVLPAGVELYQGVGAVLKPNTHFSARVRVAQGGPQTLTPAIRYGGGSSAPSHTFNIPGDGEWHFISVELVGSGGNDDLIFGGAPEGVLEIDWLQAVDGPRSSTYIPTTDSPVTRAADNAVIDLSDVLNPDEGTYVVRAVVKDDGETEYYAGHYNPGPTSPRISFRRVQGGGFEIRVGGGSGSSFTAPDLLKSGDIVTMAVTYVTGEETSYIASSFGDIRSGTSNYDPHNTINLVRGIGPLFGENNASLESSGIIAGFEYYPRALSAEELASITAFNPEAQS